MIQFNIKVYSFYINSNYERIVSGKFFDHNMIPYSREFINEMISYFLKLEEYEKCHKLKDLLDREIKHNELYINE